MGGGGSMRQGLGVGGMREGPGGQASDSDESELRGAMGALLWAGITAGALAVWIPALTYLGRICGWLR